MTVAELSETDTQSKFIYIPTQKPETQIETLKIWLIDDYEKFHIYSNQYCRGEKKNPHQNMSVSLNLGNFQNIYVSHAGILFYFSYEVNISCTNS